jgi:hypothetical protein
LVRRLIIVGLAAALAVPLHVTPPASAAILFSCPSVAPGGSSNATLTPGLSHTPSAQTVVGYLGIDSPCSNGETASVFLGTWWGNPITTYPPRPLGCPTAWGGAGPDQPDQTPILLGPTDPSFGIHWFSTGTTSEGIAKAKAGPTGTQWRIVLNVTTGKYAPPAGKKTQMKGTLNIAPLAGETYTCADDSDPSSTLELTSAGSLIVSQK